MSGVILSKLHYQDHEDRLYHETSQPSEDAILERNAQLRNNVGAIRDLGEGQEGGTWGRQVASIPFIVYEKAIRDGYDLNNPDSKVSGMEMARFLQSTEGKLCLVR